MHRNAALPDPLALLLLSLHVFALMSLGGWMRTCWKLKVRSAREQLQSPTSQVSSYCLMQICDVPPSIERYYRLCLEEMLAGFPAAAEAATRQLPGAQIPTPAAAAEPRPADAPQTVNPNPSVPNEWVALEVSGLPREREDGELPDPQMMTEILRAAGPNLGTPIQTTNEPPVEERTELPPLPLEEHGSFPPFPLIPCMPTHTNAFTDLLQCTSGATSCSLLHAGQN